MPSQKRQSDPPAPAADPRAQFGVARQPSVVLLAVLAVLLAAYVAIFYACSLPSLPGNIQRIDLLNYAVVLPDTTYLANWFGDPPRFMFRDRFGILAMAAAILAVSAALGRLLLAGLRADRGLSQLEVAVFSFGLGLNTVSLYVLAVGLAGHLGSVALFTVPAALIAAALATFYVLRWYRGSSAQSQPGQSQPGQSQPGQSRPGKSRRADWLDQRWLWLAAPFVAAIILGGMLPPFNFDVREYHLQAPKEFFQLGRITFLPHNVYANMALGSEMFSLLGMVLWGDWWYGALVGKTVIAAITPLTALGVYAAGKRLFSRRAGVAAALVYISIPWIAQVSTHGLVEGVSAFYLLLAVYAALLWIEARDSDQPSSWSRVLLAGYLAGAAVSCKYPAALFVALPLAAWIWLAGRRPNWLPAGMFIVATLVGCMPWFIKNIHLTGNPTYPLLYEIFGGATRTAQKNGQWIRAHLPSDYSIEQLLSKAGDVLCGSEWLSPLVIPLALAAWMARGQRRQVALLWGFFAYVVAVWWLVTHRIDRFWVPALPVLAILAGAGATWSASLGWRRTVTTLLICGLLSNFLFIVSGPGGPNYYFVALNRLRYSPDRLAFWHHQINQMVPPGHRVLAVGDAQVFDIEVPVLYNTVFDDCLFVRLCQGCTPAQILHQLVERRISHVYVHWGEIRRYRQHGNYGFPELVQPRLFRHLVDAGVFEPPIQSEFNPYGEVYPVRGIGAGTPIPAIPPLVPAKDG